MVDGQQFKRNIAFKKRINDLLIGKPIFDQDKFIYLELGDQKLNRVNLVGNIVDKYENTGEKKYVFFTLDDGTGQIKLRVFGDDYEQFKNFTQGQTLLIVGSLRSFNNEVYITPEIMRELDPKYLLIRKLEIEKNQKQNAPAVENTTQTVAIKDQILDSIKNSEDDGGIEIDKIIMTLRETSPEIINQEIKKLLEEGIIFEPRPGKLRYLG
jgi:RecG-like helicase